MKVSEKSLELNIGAELLFHMRSKWGLNKAYLRGLTQREERSEGVDFFAHLSPSTKLFAFQFKAPKGRTERPPYKYTLADYQHEKLYNLGRACPGSVFYVFPFYVGFSKLHTNVPTLMSDTWLLDVAAVPTPSIFAHTKTRTISCSPGAAKVNPEYALTRLDDIPIPVERGINPNQFAEWYSVFRISRDFEDSGTAAPRRRRNPWLTRGLRIVIAPPS